MSSILRGGRLAATRKDVVRYISSLEADKRILTSTILVNQAHVTALLKAKAITRADARKLLKILRKMEGGFPIREGVEDVHVLIEDYVTRCTGRDVGGKLHLAKSRNDQVATAIRMTLRDDLLEISEILISLVTTLLQVAKKHMKTVFPGYTHLQPAQPITFAHYLLANGDSLLRDNERIIQAYARVNLSPMGAAAIAGTSYNIDRNLIAKLLGFSGLVENSLDAVGSRDFILEVLAACSILALNLSRMAQDLIFYSASDVGLIDLPDAFTSTSSIMPQKKNPDTLEVLRARSARVIGAFSSSSTISHALPSGYNLDFQEITPLLWNALDSLKKSLRILIRILPRITVNQDIARRNSMQFMAATELANILVREGRIPFRAAHRAVGKAVRIALQERKTMKDLTPTEWRRILGTTVDLKDFVGKVSRTLDLKAGLQSYATRGSSSPKEAKRMILDRFRETKALVRGNVQIRTFQVNSLARLRSSAGSI